MKLNVFRTTKTGLKTSLRLGEVSDELLIKKFFKTLSLESLRRRFLSLREELLDDYLYNFFLTNSNMEIKIVVLVNHNDKKEIVGIGQLYPHPGTSLAEVALVVSDNYHNKGIGRELLTFMMQLAKKRGLKGFEGIVHNDNRPILHLCRTVGFGTIERTLRPGVYELKMYFD